MDTAADGGRMRLDTLEGTEAAMVRATIRATVEAAGVRPDTVEATTRDTVIKGDMPGRMRGTTSRGRPPEPLPAHKVRLASVCAPRSGDGLTRSQSSSRRRTRGTGSGRGSGPGADGRELRVCRSAGLWPRETRPDALP
eukprot:scaffold959_cov258-Pinguiococcus_pyrenoidosus.AAC.14